MLWNRRKTVVEENKTKYNNKWFLLPPFRQVDFLILDGAESPFDLDVVSPATLVIHFWTFLRPIWYPHCFSWADISSFLPFRTMRPRSDLNFAVKFLLVRDINESSMCGMFQSISDSIKTASRSVLNYRTIIKACQVFRPTGLWFTYLYNEIRTE